MFIHGMHAEVLRTPEGEVIVDLVAPEARFESFILASSGEQ